MDKGFPGRTKSVKELPEGVKAPPVLRKNPRNRHRKNRKDSSIGQKKVAAGVALIKFWPKPGCFARPGAGEAGWRADFFRGRRFSARAGLSACALAGAKGIPCAQLLPPLARMAAGAACRGA